MVKIIAGEKGKGKTKHMLAMANAAAKETNGTLVYLDKSTKHMFELDRKIRLIDMTGYPVRTKDAFIGFLCGITSQDHDLDTIFLDGFLALTDIHEETEIAATVKTLAALSEKSGADFVLSISLNKAQLPAELQDMVILAL